MSDYYIDDKEDDEIEESKEYASVRDNIVFLVDVRQPMLERPGDPIEGFEEEDTWFSICMKCMKNIIKSSIIGSPTDQMAVILYGTRESKNENNFDHVYVLQDLEEGSARRLKELDEIIKGGKFEETIGSATDGSSAEDLKFGLWAANNQILRTPGSTHRSVDIMTNELRPDATSAGGIQEDERDAIMTRVEALRDSKAAISLTPMVPTGQKSEPSEFWGTLLQLNPDSDEGYAPDENQLRSLRSLATVVRYRSAKKRPLRTTMLQLGPHFSIAVKLFKMLAKAGPAKKVQVYSVTNEEIITENMLTNSDTGHALTKAMLTQVCFPKDPKHELLFPRVVFTTEEAANIKRLQPEGIHLMGFKPLKYLRDHYNMKPPTFVYPTDEDLKGSSTAFRALHNGMLSTGYFAVASAVLGQGSAPQMVALLAQEEIIDDDNDQVAPPGIQMIPLPWSDDIRYPERDPTFVGTRHTFATDAQVDAAEKMLDAMQLPDDFCSSDINDPHLQRHFQVLENLALGETPVAQAPDMTLPCVNPDIKDIISKAEPCIRAFSECTVVVSAPGTTGGIKRKAADVAISEEDWKKAAANNMLDSMTIPQLKEYCDAHNLKKGGKKGDLVDRVYEHIKQ